MVEKKQEKHVKKGPKKPGHEKDRVKKLIEEKMEKIRKQEGAEKPKEEATEQKPSTAAKPKAKPLPQSAFVTGKRKRAIARGFFKPGKGMVKVNSVPIELVMPDMLRLKMMEPLMIIGDAWKRFDAKITVRGGGPSGQADAVRQVIARGLSELMGPEARKTFLSYDRNLIVYDSRRTEPHKPPHSSWGPRRYKQRSKR
jgi:small subunit ribosomal protein S9